MADLDDFLNAIDREADNAYGSDSDTTLADDRAAAIDQYLGKNTIPAPPGRSQVVDRSVFETIQWILPSLIDIFANGDDVVVLPPIGPEDTEAAKQESQYLNHIALNKTPWLLFCLTWFIDSMLTRNAYAYVYKDYKRSVEIEEYQRQTTDGLTLLLRDPDVELIAQSSYPSPDGEMEPVVGPDGQPQPEMAQVGLDASGQPILVPTGRPLMQPMALHDVTIRRTTTEGEYCLDVLPPERCLVSVKTPSFRVLEDCPYFEYYEYKPISDLRSAGYDVPDNLQDEGDGFETQEEQSRDFLGEDVQRNDLGSTDPSMRRVKARTIWIKYDYDGDGIAEMNHVIRVGRTILSRKEVGRIPVASIVPIVLPHRHVGLSICDIVTDLQDIKTALMRSGVDNLNLSNNPLKFANDKINLDDLMVSRPGAIVRGGPGSVYGQDFAPVPIPFVFPQTMQGLEYMDQVKENRTGTNRYFTGIDQNALNKTATGIQQLTSMAAQRVKLIARICGAGMRDLFDILHEVVLKSGHRKEVVQLRGQWFEVDPATWKKRKDFAIQVGFAAGNRDAMLARLNAIWNMQIQSKENGIRIATDENFFETASEMIKAADFAQPERFLTDPQKLPPPQPPPPDPLILSTQLKAQSDERIKGADIQQHAAESQDELALKKYQIDKDAETQIVLKQMDHGSAIDMETHRAQFNPKLTEARAQAAKSEGETGILHQILVANQAQTQAIGEMLNAAVQSISQAVGAMNAPKEVIRDKAGKVVGVRPAAPPPNGASS